MTESELVRAEPKYRTALYGIGGALAYAILFAISIAILVLLIRGGLWLASKLLPIAEWVAIIATVAFLPLLIVGLVRRCRGVAGSGLKLVAIAWTISLWLFSILVIADLWGTLGVLLGFVLTPLLAVPVSLLALLFHGEFREFFTTLVTAVLTLGVYLLGCWWKEQSL